MRSPLDNLHIPIVLSADPDAIYSPLGENTILHTFYSCPVRDCMNSPLDTLNISIFLDPKYKYSPFGENAMGLNRLKSPLVMVQMRSPLETLRTMTVKLVDIEAKYSPFCEKTMLLT